LYISFASTFGYTSLCQNPFQISKPSKAHALYPPPSPLSNTAREDDHLILHAKQKMSLNNTHPQPGNLTLTASYAQGFRKEFYEPLGEDLFTQCNHLDVRIRATHMADVKQQSQSGILNEDKLVPPPCCPTTTEIRRMGAAQVVILAIRQPGLLTSITLLDPHVPPQDQLRGVEAAHNRDTALTHTGAVTSVSAEGEQFMPMVNPTGTAGVWR